MVGSGARESNAVQIGAITPQISTTAVQDIVESLPVTMVGENLVMDRTCLRLSTMRLIPALVP
jgi:hypothetical protein